jgi:hypothetical protein
MGATDWYKAAVKFANEQTVEKFSVHGPYEIGSECHKFWLEQMDYEMKRQIINSK